MAEKKSNVKKPQIRLVQIASPIGRKNDQRKTLIGLGLNKMHKISILNDTDAVRGMVNKVKHLLSVEFIK